MERRRKWVDGEGWWVEGGSGIKCEDLIAGLLQINRMNDLVKVECDREGTTTVSTGYWHEETDEEYKNRCEVAKKMRGSDMVAIKLWEFTALVEKAAMYDQLCK